MVRISLRYGDYDGPVYPRGLAELLTRDGPPERCGAVVVLGALQGMRAPGTTKARETVHLMGVLRVQCQAQRRAIQPSPRFAGSPRR